MGFFGKMFSKPYQGVRVQDARVLLDDGPVLVDVRSNQEWNAGHAPAARHVIMETLRTRSGNLREGTGIVTISRSGARSARAARLLASKRYAVANVKSGMLAGKRGGGRVVAKSGREGTVI